MAESKPTILQFYPEGKRPREEAWLRPLDKQNDQTKDTEAIPVDKNHYQWMIVAKKRSGKSTLIIRVLTEIFKNHFTDIYFFSPTAGSDDKYKEVVELLQKRGTFFKVFDKNAIEKVDRKCRQNLEEYKVALEIWQKMMDDPDIIEPVKDIFRREKPEEPRHLIIFDDCVDKFGSHSDYGHPLQRLFNNGYHLRTSIWVASQQYKALTPAMRRNMDMISFFKISNQAELDHICKEINAPREVFLKAYKQATDADYGFLHVNWIRKSSVPTFFNKFTPMIIPYEDLDIVGKELDAEILKRAKKVHVQQFSAPQPAALKPRNMEEKIGKLIHVPPQKQSNEDLFKALLTVPNPGKRPL